MLSCVRVPDFSEEESSQEYSLFTTVNTARGERACRANALLGGGGLWREACRGRTHTHIHEKLGAAVKLVNAKAGWLIRKVR
jgi:hypothetical protein